MTDRIATGGGEGSLSRRLSLWAKPSSWLRTADERDGRLAATGWVQAFSTTDPEASAAWTGTGHGRGAIAVAHDGVWVANRGSRTVARLDPLTLELGAIQRFRKPPVAIVGGPAAVWAVGSSGWLWRLWPDGKGAEGVARLGRGATALATAEGLIWVLRESGRLLGLEPAGGTVAIEGRVPRGAGHMVAHGGALWVSCSRDRRLVRFDPLTGQSGTELAFPQPIRRLIVTEDALLAGCTRRLSPKRGWLHTVDTATQRITSTVELPGGPRAIACDAQTAWVACGTGVDRKGTIERIDRGSSARTTWRATDWAVGDLALLDGRLLAAMSLALAVPTTSGEFVGGGGGGGGCGGGEGGGGGGNC